MTDIQTTEDNEESGVWTPERLRELVQIGPNVEDRNVGAVLDVEVASDQIEASWRKFVRSRAWYEIGGGTLGMQAREASYELEADIEPIADLIAQAVPPELRTSATLANLDYRPYLEAIAERPNLLLRKRRNWAADSDVSRARLARDLSAKITQAYQTDLLAELNAVQDLTPEEREAAAQEDASFVPGVADLNPNASFTVRMSGGELDRLPGEQGGTFDGANVYAQQSVGFVWDLDYDMALRETVTTPTGPAYSMFEPISEMEAQYNQALQTPGMIRSGIDISTGQTRAGSQLRKLSLQGALTYMDKLDDEQYRAMQQQMYQAGYFDRLGSGYSPGDRADQATNQAWQLVLVDAYKARKPIMNVLEDSRVRRQTAYRDRWRGKLATDLADAADAIGMETFGRRLTNEEMKAVRQFVSRQQANRLPTGDPGWYNEDRAEYGFDVEDIQGGLRSMPGGTRAVITADAEADFDKMTEYWQRKRG